MKILIVSQYFWPEPFRVTDLSKELIGKGHKVTVLTGQPNYPMGKLYEEYKLNPNNFLDLNGVNIVRVPIIPRGTGFFRLFINYISFVITASILAPFKLRGKEYDVILVVQLSPVTVGLPAILLKKIKKIPMVFWVQDLWPGSLEATGAIKSKLILSTVNQLVKFIYNQSDIIIAISRAFVKDIQKNCKHPNKVSYLPNWSDDDDYNKNVTLAAEVDYRPDLFNIVFAGNLGIAQDFQSLFDAVDQLPSNHRLRWIIVGDGRETPYLEEQVAKRNLQERIILTGRYPLERMPSFFMHADALLIMLESNKIYSMTIPSKLQSYLAAGKPIIGMLEGEGFNILANNNTGLVCKSGDSKKLAENMFMMSTLKDDELNAMGKSSREYYLSEFEKEKNINKLESIMFKVTNLTRRQNIQ